MVVTANFVLSLSWVYFHSSRSNSNVNRNLSTSSTLRTRSPPPASANVHDEPKKVENLIDEEQQPVTQPDIAALEDLVESKEYKKPLENLELVLFSAVRVVNVPNIRWDGKNDLYIEVELHYSCKENGNEPLRRFFSRYASEVRMNAGHDGVWDGLNWKVPVRLSDSTEGVQGGTLDRITFNIYHANLVRTHQLIGNVSLTPFELQNELYENRDIIAKDGAGVVLLNRRLKLVGSNNSSAEIFISFSSLEGNMMAETEYEALQKLIVERTPHVEKLPIPKPKPKELETTVKSPSTSPAKKKTVSEGKNSIADTKGGSYLKKESSNSSGVALDAGGAPTIVSGRRSPDITDAQMERAEEELFQYENPRTKRNMPKNGHSAKPSSTRSINSNSSNSRETDVKGIRSNIQVIRETLRSALSPPTSPPRSGSASSKPLSSRLTEPLVRTTSRKSASTEKSESDTKPKKKVSKKKSKKSIVTTVDEILAQNPMPSEEVVEKEKQYPPRVRKERELCMIDKAFETALQQCSACVTLTYREVDSLLESVGVRHSVASTAEELARNSQTISLPLHKIPLAATLSEYIRTSGWPFVMDDSSSSGGPRDHSVSSGGVAVNLITLSENHAAVIIKSLSKLISGPWKQARALIIDLCSSSGLVNVAADAGYNSDSSTGKFSGTLNNTVAISSTQKPDTWSTQSVMQLLSVLQLPLEYFRNCEGGNSLLEMPDHLWSHSNQLPSHLQLRWCTYKQTLRILNAWWSSGIRPGDKQQKVPRDPSKKKLGKGTCSSGGLSMSCKGNIDCNRSSSQDSHMLADGEQLSEDRDGNRNEPLKEFINGIPVKICHADELLKALIPVNRAYGLGLNLTQIASVASYIGGHLGCIARKELEAECGPAYKNCRWICFDSAEIAHAFGLIFPSILENPDVIMKESNSNAALLRTFCRMIKETEVAVLIPEQCLKKPNHNDTLHILRKQSRSFKRYDDIRVGDAVDLAPLVELKRAYERFDWWDRPDEDTLKRIHSKSGEVVAISELHCKGRIGVHITEAGVTDAIPIEALYQPLAKGVTDGTSGIPKLTRANSLVRCDSPGGGSVYSLNLPESGSFASARTPSYDPSTSTGGMPKAFRPPTPLSRCASRNSNTEGIAGSTNRHINSVSRNIHSRSVSETQEAGVESEEIFDSMDLLGVPGGDEMLPHASDEEQEEVEVKQPVVTSMKISAKVPAPAPVYADVEVDDSLDDISLDDDHRGQAPLDVDVHEYIAPSVGYSWLSKEAVHMAKKMEGKKSQFNSEFDSDAKVKKTSKVKKKKDGTEDGMYFDHFTSHGVNYSAPKFDERNAEYDDGSSRSYRKSKSAGNNRGKKGTREFTGPSTGGFSSPKKKESKKKQELESIVAARQNRVDNIVLESREYNLAHDIMESDRDVTEPLKNYTYKQQVFELGQEDVEKNAKLNEQRLKVATAKAHEYHPSSRSPSPTHKKNFTDHAAFGDKDALIVESTAIQHQSTMNWVNVVFPENGVPLGTPPRKKTDKKTRPKSAPSNGRTAADASKMNDLSPVSQKLLATKVGHVDVSLGTELPPSKAVSMGTTVEKLIRDSAPSNASPGERDPNLFAKMHRRTEKDSHARKEKILLKELRRMNRGHPPAANSDFDEVL